MQHRLIDPAHRVGVSFLLYGHATELPANAHLSACFQQLAVRTKVAISAAMTASFGERLRQQREAQNIDLVAIADLTKIKRSLLEGLERDDLSQWPHGIFRRSWVRWYAQAIGLDPEQTVQEFNEAYPDPEELAAAQAAAAQAATNHDGLHRNGFRGLVGAALGTLSRRMRGPSNGTAGTAAAEVMPVTTVAPAHSSQFDLQAVARLCTKFGQAGSAREVQPLLQEVATLLDATGLIVWLWHSTSAVLRPALVHGYSAGVVARLPAVTRDADNPTAESFRSAQPREIDGDDECGGALVLPLLLRAKCVGVLAIELQPGMRLTDSARAIATILAAVLTQLVSRSLQSEPRPAATQVQRVRLTPVRGAV